MNNNRNSTTLMVGMATVAALVVPVTTHVGMRVFELLAVAWYGGFAWWFASRPTPSETGAVPGPEAIAALALPVVAGDVASFRAVQADADPHAAACRRFGLPMTGGPQSADPVETDVSASTHEG